MVGFRFTAVYLSRRFPGLTGYVRNMPDGRVEILAECNEKTFKDFLNVINESSLARGIADTTFKSKPIEKKQYSLFEIHA